jgi:hypothetical protein
MNLSRLLRTALFSALGLLVAGGLMTVQAQDVIVDEDDPDNPPTTFDTITEGLNEIDDGETLLIRAGGYGETLDLTSANFSGGESFTLQIEIDDDSQADFIRITDVVVGDGAAQVDVDIQSDGTAAFELNASNVTPDIDLVNGDFDLGASRQLQFRNTGSDIDVQRDAGSSISTSSPQYDGNDVNLTYDISGGDVDAGLEAPTDLQTGTLAVSDNGNDTDNTLTFPSGRFGTFAAERFGVSDEVNVTFEGDFSVERGNSNTQIEIAIDQSLTVDGELEIDPGTSTDNPLVVNSLDSNGDAVTLGSLTFGSVQSDNTGRSNATGALVQGNGVLDVTGAVTFQAEENGAGGSERFLQEVQAEASTSDFSIGSVDETADGGGPTDSTEVDIRNGNNGGGSVELGGGEIRGIDNNGNGSSLDITGDVQARISEAPIRGAFGVDNGGNESTINISSGATLTLRNDNQTGPPNVTDATVRHRNSDNGGFTGDGKILVNNVSDGDQDFDTVANNNNNASVDINFLPDIEFTGSGGNDIFGTSDGSGPNGITEGIRIGGDLTADVDVNLFTNRGGARVAGATNVDGGTTDLTGVSDATSTRDAELNNSGTLDIRGTTTLEVRRDLNRNNRNAALLTTSRTTLEFTDSAEDGELDTQTLFTIRGEVRVNKPGATLTIPEAVTIDGDLTIVDQGASPRTTLDIGDNVFLEGGGTFTVDSNHESQGDSRIVFQGSSDYTVAGTDTLDRALVQFGSPSEKLDVDPDGAGAGTDQTLEFDSELEVRTGDVNPVNSGDELLPADNSDAAVTRFIDGGNQEFTTGTGTFNGAGNEYDLTYTNNVQGGASSRATTGELVDGVGNLTVQNNTTILLNKGVRTPTSPALSDDNVVVNGALSVGEQSQIQDAQSSQTFELAGSGETHEIDGLVEGDNNNNPITLDVTGSGSTLQGNQVTSSNPRAAVENLTVSASGVSTTDLQEIRGNLTINSGAGLTLGMSDEQEVEGRVTADGDLTLDSEVTMPNANSVSIASSSAATLDFQGNDLVLDAGVAFSGTSDASYESSGGALIFNSGSPSFGTARVPVPRVDVNVGLSLTDDAAVDEQLTVNNQSQITSSGNDFVLTGTADLNGAGDFTAFNATLGSGGTFVAEGGTINVNGGTSGDREITLNNFTVDSGNSTVTVQEDGDGNDDDLVVDGQFSLDTGTLEHSTDVELSGSNSGFDEFVYVAGTISRVDEFVQFDGGGNFTLDLQADVTVPYLNVTDVANFDDTEGESLTIGSELLLQDNFNQTSNDGDIVIADGALIERQADGSSGVLDREPTFSGVYDLTYSGGTDITSGFELTTDAQTLRNVTVDFNSSTDEVDFSDTELSSNVDAVVNGELDLDTGRLVFDGSDARQVVMADGSTVRRTSNGSVLDPLTQPAAPATYTLEYTGTNSITASTDEFIGTGRINLVTSIGNNNIGNQITANVLPTDRTVETFEVNNEADDQTQLSNGTSGFDLTVTGNTTVTAGVLGGTNGTLAAEGDVTDAGGTFAGTGLVLSFEGDQQDLNLDDGPEAVDEVALRQQDGDSRVTVTNNTLQVDANDNDGLIFRDGLLVGASIDDVVVDLVNPSTGVPIDHNPNTSSHVVGQVQVNVPAGTPESQGTGLPRGRFEFPVGSESSYRPVFVTFRTDNQVETNTEIRFGHVPENPGGSQGLPIDDAGTTDEGETLSIGSYLDQYWFASANPGLGTSQSFDLEVRTEGSTIRTENPERDELRIIRRFAGATSNEWRLQGDGTQYDNQVDTGSGRVTVRTQDSPGGLVDNGALFTIGLPTDLPEFTASTFTPSDLTVQEGETLTAEFEASSRDVGQAVTIDTTDIPSSVDPDSVIVTSNQLTDSTAEATVEFTPGFEGGDRTVDLTVQASDDDGFTESTFAVTVNDAPQGVSFAGGAAPSDADGIVARDTARSSDNPATFQVTAEVADPGSDGSALSFDTDVGWASASVASTSGDQATATVTLRPGFAQAQSAAQGDGTLDVGITATDDNTSESTSGTASVDVEFDRNVGDVDGSGSISGFDASFALAIAVGKTEFNGGTIVDAEVRAADFDPPSQGDTLDADRDDVNSYDALRIFQNRAGAGRTTAAAQKASTSGRQGGLIQVGEMDKKDGTALVSIVLEEGSGVQAADVEVELSSGASVKDVQTSVPEEWISNHNAEDGVLKIGMAGEQALPTGKIATVRLDLGGSEEPFESGTFRVNGAGAEDLPVETAPSEFKLGSNYPNPVESGTTIEYDLKEASSVTIEVYNTLGQRVATLVDQEKEAGSYTVRFEAGSDLSSGVYFYRMQAGDFTETKRITVVR